MNYNSDTIETNGNAKKHVKSKRLKREQLTAYLFIAPQFLGLLCFVLIPAFMVIILCFSDWDLIGKIDMAGLVNFKNVFEDARLGKSLLNTLIFFAGIVPLTIVLSFGLAFITNQNIKGTGFYKSAYFLPMATASVAVVLVWYWIYAPNIGIINYVLSIFGISGPGWLTDSFWARMAIILMCSWQNIGYNYLIFLAGLKNIPKEYYEAADMDGANSIQKLKSITLPMLSPTTFFILITISISVLNIFQEPMVMTKGGPEFSTYTIVAYIYDLAFKFFRMGEAAVVSMVLFIAVIILTAVQFHFSKRWVYEND